MVFLYTDYLLYALIMMIVMTGGLIVRRPFLLQAWKSLLTVPRTMGALVILSVYLSVALLDSVHFKSDSMNDYGMVSLLDLIVKPQAQEDESTYSAPLAIYSYVKETVHTHEGQQRVVTRLHHAGNHLSSEDDRWLDIAQRLAKGGLKGLLISFALCAGLIQWVAYRSKKSFKETLLDCFYHSALAWKTLFGMILLIGLLLGMIGAITGYYHILGTDKIGKDVFYQAVKSVRTGIIIGTVTTLLMLPFATLLGIMAGFYKRRVDDVVQYVYTTLSAIPAVLLIAASILTLDAYMANHADLFNSMASRTDARLLALCIILGVTSWTSLCRLLRGETLKLVDSEMVTACRVVGVSNRSIMWRHILPNVFPIILICVVLDFSGLVLAEAVLSYVGVGVDPASYSWGTMINGARLEMARDPIVWWSLAGAFGFMFILVLSSNIVADGVRDVLDPRFQGSNT